MGLTTPSLLSNDFIKYGLETHEGNKNAKEIFKEKYGKIIRRHQEQPLLYSMIAINVAVYGFWKINATFMQKHFLCNLQNIQSKRY